MAVEIGVLLNRCPKPSRIAFEPVHALIVHDDLETFPSVDALSNNLSVGALSELLDNRHLIITGPGLGEPSDGLGRTFPRPISAKSGTSSRPQPGLWGSHRRLKLGI